MIKDIRAGFTLIEMLVVITIIGIIISIGLSSFDSNDGLPLGVAGERFASAAREARERSLAEGKKVRLAFRIGAGDGDEGDRRAIFVHVFDEGEEGGEWRLAGDPEYLPEGIYLDTERSSGMRAGIFRPGRNAEESESLGLVFRPDQRCDDAGARIVLGAAVGGDGVALKMKREGLAVGFLVSRTGHVTRWEMREEGP